MNLDGYIGALGQLPSYDQLRMNALAIRGEQQRQDLLAREAPLKLRQQEQELAEQNALKADLMALGDNASPDQYWKLAARYPMLKGISSAAQGLSDAQRRQVVGTASQIHAALQSNRPDLARAMVQRSIDADKASGNQPDPDDLALLGLIDSGDADQLRAAKGMTYALVAASNPDTAAKNLNDSMEGERDFTLAPGSRRYNARGEIIAEAPFAPQYRAVGEGQTLVELGGTRGGDPASTGGRADGSWETFHANFLGPTEGGYADRDGASGAPVNFGVNQKFNPDLNVKDLTAAQAKGILHDRYWKASGADRLPAGLAEVHGDTAVNMGVNAAARLLKQSGGDAERYLQLREKRYRSIGGPDLGAWLNRNNALRQYVGLQDGGGTGGTGARVVAQGAPKPGAARMTPEEVRAEGLDPATVYYRGADGIPRAVAGQGKKEGADQPYSQSALDAFDRAIGTAQRLLKHPGLTAGVGMPSINPLDGNLAGWVVPGSKAADFRTELDTMKSQVFLPMVQSMKGMGALSNAEGEKLTAAIGNLSTRQSEGSFKASLQRIIKDLNYYKQRGAKRGSSAPASAPAGFRILAVRPK